MQFNSGQYFTLLAQNLSRSANTQLTFLNGAHNLCPGSNTSIDSSYRDLTQLGHKIASEITHPFDVNTIPEVVVYLQVLRG